MKNFFFIAIAVLFFSCKNETKPIVAPKTEHEVIEEITLNPKQVFLKENGMSPIDLTDDEFAMLEKAVELGLFKEKNFCQFYEEYKILEFAQKYKESDKVISSFKKVSNLDFLLGVKGAELCPEALTRAKISRDGKKTVYLKPKINPCEISKDFIRKDLQHPSTASFSTFDCSSEVNSDNSFTILRKVSAKNSFGLELEFIYKLRFGFTGGNETDIKNWKLIGIVSEEYGK